MTRPARNLLAVFTLFFTAPLVAEFLLGDLSLKLLPALLVLAPTYGGGALLIRETARRAGRGWPSMLVLGAAYALLAEGFVTQSLFNPDYLRLHGHFLSHGWIPALGIGAWWTLFMLNLHAFWSMGVSIALVEGLFPPDAGAPWLGRIGDGVVAVVFLLGSVAVRRYTLRTEHFMASSVQAAGTAVVCVLLIGLAFWLPKAAVRGGAGFRPWIAGVGAFVLGMMVLVTPPFWDWGAAAALLGLDAVFLLGLGWFSRRDGWSAMHTFSLGAGGALAYGVHAFFAPPLGQTSVGLALAGHVVFLALALGVIALGARRSGRAVAIQSDAP
jgi:hypothetical protein